MRVAIQMTGEFAIFAVDEIEGVAVELDGDDLLLPEGERGQHVAASARSDHQDARG
ncbi:MAG: hypothetical protein HC897_04405 [Thermoanaerobaculia bacterium]|nr:hypothetical protein [Thermoanaerobaculia bacterium]